MVPTIRSAGCRYGIALSSVALALLLTWLLKPFFSATPALLLFLAVISSTWYGGLRAGTLATLLRSRRSRKVRSHSKMDNSSKVDSTENAATMVAGKEGTYMISRKRSAAVLAILFFSGGLLLWSGCEREGPMERAGEQIDEAVEETKDALDPAGPAERAGEKVDRAVEDVTE